MSRRVAITGATGFVGRHLVEQLLADGDEVTAIVRPTSDVRGLETRIAIASLDDIDSLAAAIAGCEIVYHLASAVDFGGDWPRFRQVNITGTANVLAAARRAGLRRVVHCSSIVAVGASRHPTRIDESCRWNLRSLNVPYVTTKREAEVLALAARDIDVVVANPACVIGPGDLSGSEFGTLCQRFWRGRLPIHFGGGNNFVDVRDVARGLRLVAERGRSGERYLLVGANRTMTAFFSELAKAAGRSVPRLRLPGFLGSLTAFLEANYSSGRRERAYLSPAQARLLPYFFYFDGGKAERELGFVARPLARSLADAFASWEAGRRAA